METQRFVRWLQDQLASQGIFDAQIILDWNAFSPNMPTVTIQFHDGSVLKGHPATPLPPTVWTGGTDANQFWATDVDANPYAFPEEALGFTPKVIMPYGLEGMSIDVPQAPEAARELERITREIMSQLQAGEQLMNVRDFGAVGDGVHDDTTAIQAAIDAAGAQNPVKTAQKRNENEQKLTEKEQNRLNYLHWRVKNGELDADFAPEETFPLADVLAQYVDDDSKGE